MAYVIEERPKEIEKQLGILNDLNYALKSKDLKEYIGFIQTHGLDQTQRIRLSLTNDIEYMVSELTNSILSNALKTYKDPDDRLVVLSRYGSNDVRSSFQMLSGRLDEVFFHLNFAKKEYEIDYRAINRGLSTGLLEVVKERSMLELITGSDRELFFTESSLIDDGYFFRNKEEPTVANVESKLREYKNSEVLAFEKFGADTLNEAIKNVFDEIQDIQNYIESEYEFTNASEKLESKSSYSFKTPVRWSVPEYKEKRSGIFSMTRTVKQIDIPYNEINTHHTPYLKGPTFIRGLMYFVENADPSFEDFFERSMMESDFVHLSRIAGTKVGFSNKEINEDLVSSEFIVDKGSDSVQLKVDGVKVLIKSNGSVIVYNNLKSDNYLDQQGIIKVMANAKFRLFLRVAAFNTFEVADPEKRIYRTVEVNENYGK